MPPAPNATPSKETQLPTQPMPNPNNKPQQQQQVFPTDPNNYPVNSLNISDMHLRSGTTLPTPSPLVITKLPSEEIAQETTPDKLGSPEKVHQSATLDTHVRTPLFPQRLQVEVSRQQDDIAFDLIDQLKYICVKFPLFQAIKDIPIYGKVIKETCLKIPKRKKKDPKTMHVVGQLADIMLGKNYCP